MPDLDLEKMNEIDMECACPDDEDTFVVKVTPVSKFKNQNVTFEPEASEERDLISTTGVIIDLNDEEDIATKPIKTITAVADNNGINITKNYNDIDLDSEFSDYNEIDMECSIGDDDDEDCIVTAPKIDPNISETHIKGEKFKSEKSYDDYMEDIRFNSKELVDEDMLEEKKKIDQGTVEANYWDKLQKKHAATNKKGAYNTHFHIAGNPEKERELFNHDMTPQGKIPTIGLGGEGMDAEGHAVGSTASAGEASGEAVGAGEGGGMGESLEITSCPCEKGILDQLFDLIGFEVVRNNDGSCLAIDLVDEDNSFDCKDNSELMSNLKPYIDDCLICPLQIKTGENFDDYADWCNWYTDENKEKYPECEWDIKCCEELLNQ